MSPVSLRPKAAVWATPGRSSRRSATPPPRRRRSCARRGSSWRQAPRNSARPPRRRWRATRHGTSWSSSDHAPRGPAEPGRDPAAPGSGRAAARTGIRRPLESRRSCAHRGRAASRAHERRRPAADRDRPTHRPGAAGGAAADEDPGQLRRGVQSHRRRRGDTRDAPPDRRGAARAHETIRVPDQHGAGRHHRRGGARRRAQGRADRRCRARRVRARAPGVVRAADHGKRRAVAAPGQRHARDPRRDGPARAREPQGVLRRHGAARPGGVSQAVSAPIDAPDYLQRTAGLLYDCLLDVIRAHEPDIERVLRGEQLPAGAPAELVGRAIQAQGTWFQLLSIAEQNAAMRQRRQAEVERGPEQVRGTFAQVVAAAAAAGVPAEEVRALVAGLRVRPVITAHPTEAKRVTVLEKHRRIYRRLVDLEAPRWTPRERSALIDNVRAEIELLWLSGELRLEKPTVEQELAWGLYFVHENLFGIVPELADKLEQALGRAYPDASFDVPPFFQVGCWIGGDRDGNPFVTNDATRRTLCETRVASLRRYRLRLAELLRALSITDPTAVISPAFRTALAPQPEPCGPGDASARRNPGEVFRQFLTCVLRRLDATLVSAEQGQTAPEAEAYATADDLIVDLRTLEAGLTEAQCATAAGLFVRPVRREVEAFRFSTFRLDIRENSSRLNEALRALWRARRPAEPPASESPEWRAWLQAELVRPLGADHAPPDLPAEGGATETVGMFRLIRETRDRLDREAIGSFVLSMTHSVSDVLGAYVFAKQAGLFADAAGTESCTLPVVPAVEAIDDPRRAPDIGRGAAPL